MLSYLPILIAVLGGVAVVIQARFNGMMDKGMGTMESVFITYGLGGLIIALVVWRHRGNIKRMVSGSEEKVPI